MTRRILTGLAALMLITSVAVAQGRPDRGPFRGGDLPPGVRVLKQDGGPGHGPQDRPQAAAVGQAVRKLAQRLDRLEKQVRGILEHVRSDAGARARRPGTPDRMRGRRGMAMRPQAAPTGRMDRVRKYLQERPELRRRLAQSPELRQRLAQRLRGQMGSRMGQQMGPRRGPEMGPQQGQRRGQHMGRRQGQGQGRGGPHAGREMRRGGGQAGRGMRRGGGAEGGCEHTCPDCDRDGEKGPAKAGPAKHRVKANATRAAHRPAARGPKAGQGMEAENARLRAEIKKLHARLARLAAQIEKLH